MRKFALLLAFSLLTPALAAGTTTVTGGGTTSSISTIVVSANILNACTLTTTDIALGDYTATASAPLSGSTNVTVQCNNGAQYALSGVPATLALAKAGVAATLNADITTNLPTGTVTSAGVLNTYTVSAALAPSQYSVPSGASYTGVINVQIDLLN